MFAFHSRRDPKTSNRLATRRSQRNRRLIPTLNRLEERIVLSSSFYVTSSADSGPGSLRQAVSDASSGDQIYFTPSVGPTIGLSSEIMLDKNLDIFGPGASALQLDGQSAHRIFELSSGTQVRLYDMTISNGWEEQGGAIESTNAQLICNHVSFALNAATGNLFTHVDALGGAIHATGGSIEIYFCKFTNNVAVGPSSEPDSSSYFRPLDGDGGAVYGDGTAVYIADSSFSKCVAYGGKSLDSKFDGGYAFGGAVCAFNSPAVSLQNVTFTNNGAFGGAGSKLGGIGGAAEGGAVYTNLASYGGLILTDGSFTSNQALAGTSSLSKDVTPDAMGGGLMIDAKGSSKVQVGFRGLNKFVSNTATAGNVLNRLSNDPLVGNGGTGFGGGLAIDMTGAISAIIETGAPNPSPTSLLFQQNSVRGGNGGAVTLYGESLSAAAGGNGGVAMGGGMAILLDATVDCRVALDSINAQKNFAIGGDGGPGFFSSGAGNGGNAIGGGIYFSEKGAIAAAVVFSHGAFVSNTATGGNGTYPGLLGGSGVNGQRGSNGGSALGGGFGFDATGSVASPFQFNVASFSSNTAQGGAGGQGGAVSGGIQGGTGGTGGPAEGGAFQGILDGAAQQVISFDKVTFSSNKTQGGTGGAGGTAQGVGVGGNGGYGGVGAGGAVDMTALEADSVWYFSNINAVGNKAVGGTGGVGASGPSGNGIGGPGGGAGGGAFLFNAPSTTAFFDTSNITLNQAQGGLPSRGSTLVGPSTGGGILVILKNLTLSRTVRVISNQAANSPNIYGTYIVS